MAARFYRKFAAILLVLAAPAAGLWLAAQTPTRIVIMHTNDVHGQLLPRNGVGGIAQIATIIRRANPDLILDAGDIFTGTLLSDEFAGVPTIQAMNKIGYTAGTIGNHEFDYGQSALRMRLREAKFPVLSANLQAPISEIKKYSVVTAKGIRFAIIGLTTEEVKTKSHPDQVKGVTVLDTIKTLEQLLPEVRRRADFIIATVHLEEIEEQRLAKAFPEIRLIVGGHIHDVTKPVKIGETLVVKTGSNGRNVGRVDIEFIGKKTVRMESQLIPVTNVTAAADVASLLIPFQRKVEAKMAEVVGEAAADLRYSRSEESPLANMIADAFREKGKTQIAFQNVGGIRANILKGPITWGRVFEVLPFQNRLFTMKLTGAQIKKTLLVGLNSTVGLMGVSGLRVRFDRSKEGDNRIVSLTLPDGTPIDDSAVYSVTTNDFVAVGGDGYNEFLKATDAKDNGILLRDVFADYIKARRVLSPLIDGRVTFENSRTDR